MRVKKRVKRTVGVKEGMSFTFIYDNIYMLGLKRIRERKMVKEV